MRLTKLELEVMDYFWNLGEVSVREVHEAIPAKKRPAFTTVQTIVQRLEQKGALRRTRKVGNALLFETKVTRKSVYRRLIDDFLELFGGSGEPIIAHLVETGRLDLQALAKAEKLAKGRRKS
ncbi:MAG TPA: BlaI/MecI/CopY family transcriptional regulator [Thermoanaerobaculia bacterium]|nr:BlaI/MecI/CopY family transcriptional regulator [Thermoanaerobaculia bacterium]